MNPSDDQLAVILIAVGFVALGLWIGVAAAQPAVGRPLLSAEQTGQARREQASPAAESGLTTRMLAVQASPTPTRPPTATPTPTPTPSPTRTPRPSATATPSVTPTSGEPGDDEGAETPTPVPTPVAEAHFWLERPISPDGVNTIARFYPYASTGEGHYPVHHGVEFVNPEGTPVLAVAPGTVVFAGPDDAEVVGPSTDFYGLVVVQELDRRWKGKPVYVVYGHLSAVLVEEGQPVETGEPVGLVGMTGVAMGPHLHLEVRVGGRTYADVRNPELWLKPRPGHGVIVGRVLDTKGQPVREALVTVQEPDGDDLLLYTYSYAGDEVLPDEEWQENLVIGDVPAGTWRVAARIGERTVVRDVVVREGQIAFVVLQP